MVHCLYWNTFCRGALLFNTHNGSSADNGGLPIWLAVLGYGAASIVQYLYDRYSPAVQQANRISRKFVWWKRVTLILIHGLVWVLFLTPDHTYSLDGIVVVIILTTTVSLWPIWVKDMTNQIKL